MSISPPENIDEAAKSAWDRICEQLEVIGEPVDAYYDAVLLYSESFAKYQDAKTKVEELGQAITDGGIVKPNPFAAEMHKHYANCKAFLNELGLTPEAESRRAARAEKARQMISIDQLGLLLGAIMSSIGRHVTDENTRRSIGADLEKAIEFSGSKPSIPSHTDAAQ